MARTLHCTVVEVPAMSDPHEPRTGGFRDLVPWADPYIAALVEKLRRLAEFEDEAVPATKAELPPPLTPDDRPPTWQADWSERNWPRSG